MTEANHTSRRALLRALAISPVAATGCAATGLLLSRAEASSSPDAELLATYAQWRASLVEYDAAGQAVDEASGRVDWPEAPEDLFIRPGDSMSLVSMSCPHHGGRRWLGTKDRVEYLRSTYVVDRAAEEWLSPEYQRRACGVVEAYDRWMAAEKAAAAAAGLPEAQERERRVIALSNELRRAIANLPAKTLAGVRAKTEVAVWCLGGADGLEPPADGFSHDSEDLQVSILRDLLRMGEGGAA